MIDSLEINGVYYYVDQGKIYDVIYRGCTNGSYEFDIVDHYMFNSAVFSDKSLNEYVFMDKRQAIIVNVLRKDTPIL